MLLGLIAFCTVVMRCFPETTLARWLNTTLVEQPLAWLSKLKRRDVILLFVIIGLLLVGDNFIMLFGMGELVAIAVNLSVYFDAALAVYFDAVLVATAVTIAAALVTAWRSIRVRLSPRFSALAQRRVRAARESKSKPRQPKPLNNEDAPARGLAFAA